MKIIFTVLTFVLVSQSFGQEKMFIHTSEDETHTFTILDHSLLNGNPDAKPIISHLYSLLGHDGVYSNNTTGVAYINHLERWVIYNEEGAASTLPPSSSYFVYVPSDTYAIRHIATEENSHLFFTKLYFPLIFENPDAIVVTSNNRQVVTYNPHNYAVWYNTGNDSWYITMEEDIEGDMPLGAGFHAATEGEEGVVGYRHRATAENIYLNYTRINHPLLNNNPDARFVFSHNVGLTGDDPYLLLDKVLGAWYNGGQWTIYTEDQSDMRENALFDLLIFNPVLSTAEQADKLEAWLFPNPVKDKLHISAIGILERVEVYNLSGQQLLNQAFKSTQIEIKTEDLTPGTYIIKLTGEKGSEVRKFIKR